MATAAPRIALNQPDRAGTKSDVTCLSALGKRVRQLREDADLTRKQLAARAGVSERYLAQLESGAGNSSILMLRHVALALGVELEQLFGDLPASMEHRLLQRFLDAVPGHKREQVLLRLVREYGQDAAGRKSRIALVGLRGAGKSTLGAALAGEMECPFIELDREIEREAGMKLAEVFSLYGQGGFRRLERRCLEQVLRDSPRAVLAVGGGLVTETATYERLLESCFTVWLQATPEEHMQRVIAQGDLRPMAGNAEAMEDLRQILRDREPLYRKADFELHTAGQSLEASLLRLRQAIAA